MDELSQILKENLDGVTEELANSLPKFNFMPDIPDEKIKEAIWKLTPQAVNNLSARFGMANVIGFINNFQQGRRW